MFDNDGNGTAVLVRPNAGPINICLKEIHFSLLDEIKLDVKLLVCFIWCIHST